MGKALVGVHADPSALRLLDEIRVLRARVAELEAALALAQAADEPAAGDAEPRSHAAGQPEVAPA